MDDFAEPGDITTSLRLQRSGTTLPVSAHELVRAAIHVARFRLARDGPALGSA